MSVTTFANSDWDLSVTAENNHARNYPSINTDIALYWNDDFESYKTWLEITAPYHTTSDAPLTTNDLDNFESKISSYDGWSIHILHNHETINAIGEAATVCIYRAERSFDTEEPGMQCIVSAAVSISASDTYNTFWFPEGQLVTVLSDAEAGTLDLMSGDYDDYIIDSIYTGMDHYDIRRTGANGFEADKFMLEESTSYNYSLNDDIRFEINDEVDIYTLFRSSGGVMTG